MQAAEGATSYYSDWDPWPPQGEGLARRKAWNEALTGSASASSKSKPPTAAHYTNTPDNVGKILGSGRLFAPDSKVAQGGAKDLEIATPMIEQLLRDFAAAQPYR